MCLIVAVAPGTQSLMGKLTLQRFLIFRMDIWKKTELLVQSPMHWNARITHGFIKSSFSHGQF